MDYDALKTEIQTDPKGLGYAPFVASGADGSVAALLNAATGPGAQSVNLPTLSSDTVRKIVFPCISAWPAASAAVQTKWQQWLATLQGGVGTVDNDAEFQALLSALVADFGALTGSGGVPPLDAARVTRYTTKVGSRAEVLFDEVGVVVTHEDVAKALRG